MKYQKICTMLAAKRCHEAGQSIEEIAKAANVSPTTIRRWLSKFP